MMDLRDAAQASGGRLQGENARFRGVSTDSRMLGPGELFVAIAGERFDGHAFLEQARAAGAAGALVQQDRVGAEVAPEGLPLVVVADTRAALGSLAAHWRSRFAMPVIALTGSNGKTTVKEMLASILRHYAGSAGAVLATRGNLNNDIGVPLTLFGLRPHHAYAVIEMGMNHPGEIGYLSRLARPDVAIVTNAGRAHLQGLGSVEAVARAKGEIFEGLSERGIAVINADDPHAELWRGLAQGRRCVEFGLDKRAHVRAEYRLEAGGSQVFLGFDGAAAAARLPVPGLHNVRNALAAAAAAWALEVSLNSISEGLARFAGVPGRLVLTAGVNGALLLDDTYNANPESVRAALQVLAAADGRRGLVLGDMGELGPDAPRLHQEIGAEARKAGIDFLLALGELSRETAQAFGPGARHFERIEDLLAAAEGELAPGVTLLVKGSRFMKMERVVQGLRAPAEAAPGTAA